MFPGNPPLLPPPPFYFKHNASKSLTPFIKLVQFCNHFFNIYFVQGLLLFRGDTKIDGSMAFPMFTLRW